MNTVSQLIASFIFGVCRLYTCGGKSFYEPTKFIYILCFTFWNVPLLSVFEMVTNTICFTSSRPLFLSFLQNNQNNGEQFFIFYFFYMHPVLCPGMMTKTNIWLLFVWTNQMVKNCNLFFKVFDVLVLFHLNASCTQSTTF